MDKDIYTYPDGAKYKGDWKNGKRHGRGIWIRPDGMKYEGEWENDKPNGQGTLTHPNGEKRIGLWQDGKFIGETMPIETQNYKTQELIASHKNRIQELERANQDLKHEIGSLRKKIAKLEGPKDHEDIYAESDFYNGFEQNEGQQVHKKPVRKKSKVWWALASILLLLVVVIIIANIGDKEVSVTTPEEQVEEPTELSEDYLIDEMLDILEINFEGSAKAHVDKANKMFILTPTDPDLIDAFTYVAEGHEEMTQIYRDNLESQRFLSETIAEILPEYSLAIANPHDPDLLLVVTWNGIVIYDFTDDL